MKAVVTVVGKDRVGIIAKVCAHLASYNVNVLDISQTVMQGYFTMMMVVDVSESALAVAELARELNTIVLLKGNRTVITDGNRSYMNTTGNPGMATGGSGDVLAGIIVSLLGQGILPLEAIACAAWLHGAAGDICALEIGQYGMLPSDMVNVLPRLLK